MAALKAEAKQTVESREAELATARREGEALKGRLQDAEGKLKVGSNSLFLFITCMSGAGLVCNRQ